MICWGRRYHRYLQRVRRRHYRNHGLCEHVVARILRIQRLQHARIQLCKLIRTRAEEIDKTVKKDREYVDKVNKVLDVMYIVEEVVTNMSLEDHHSLQTVITSIQVDIIPLLKSMTERSYLANALLRIEIEEWQKLGEETQ